MDGVNLSESAVEEMVELYKIERVEPVQYRIEDQRCSREEAWKWFSERLVYRSRAESTAGVNVFKLKPGVTWAQLG